MRTMKAAVIYEGGGPEVLKIESRPIPMPRPGEVVISGQGVRAKPVGVVYPAGSFSWCRLSSDPRH
jgi:NADPH:quinone reductase-like Zn-dependent oxidoreductase